MNRKPKPYELSIPSISLRQFDYNSANRTLVAEASDLGEHFRIRRLYNDACDEGIAILSHHTNRIQKFVLSTVDKDSEGDVAGWWFVPAIISGDPPCKVKKVLIIND